MNLNGLMRKCEMKSQHTLLPEMSEGMCGKLCLTSSSIYSISINDLDPVNANFLFIWDLLICSFSYIYMYIYIILYLLY